MSHRGKLEMRNDDLSNFGVEKAHHALPEKTGAGSTCGAVALEWSAVCGNCQAFDTIIWKEPPRVGTLQPLDPKTNKEASGPVIENAG
jgi:Predicted ATP-dependent serine protease